MGNVKKGFLLLHRKIEGDWKWGNPLYRSAWIWLLVNANWTDEDGLQRGQVRFAVTQAPALWGMSKATAARFLGRCQREGDIRWQKGRGGWQKHETQDESQDETQDETQDESQVGLITILKYKEYQGVNYNHATQDETQDATQDETQDETLKRTIREQVREQVQNKEKGRPHRKMKPKTGQNKVPSPFVEVRNFYCEQFLEIRGTKYVYGKAKDSLAIKRLLEVLSVEEIKTRILDFLNDSLDWKGGYPGHTIALFSSRVNTYPGHARDPTPTPPSHRPVKDDF